MTDAPKSPADSVADAIARYRGMSDKAVYSGHHVANILEHHAAALSAAPVGEPAAWLNKLLDEFTEDLTRQQCCYIKDQIMRYMRPAPSVGAEEITHKIIEAKKLFYKIDGDYTDPGPWCDKGAALLNEALALLSGEKK